MHNAGSEQPLEVRLRDAVAGTWLRFHEPVALLQTRRLGEVPRLVAQAAERVAAEALHAVGYLCYEAAGALNPEQTTRPPGWMPLCWFALYRTAADTPAPIAMPSSDSLYWQPSIDADRYTQRLERIRHHIARGDTYQVNFSYRLRARLGRELANQPYTLFCQMLARQPQGYGAYVETPDWAICCASHELFFEHQGTTVTSRPMKGTVRRGSSAAEDAALAAWLRNSAKNRAENLMITDMVRNDLGRIARTGSVRTESLFALEPYPTLWQMTSTVTAETDRPLVEVLRAMFPAASITGAPKRQTMSLIAELEDDPRQIYTGTICYLRPDGSAQFNVAIRTALVSKRTRTAEYGVGGGIVWDSDPAEEYQESLTKARIVQAPGGDFELLETLLWTAEDGFFLLEQHIARLCRAARFFRRPADAAKIRRRLDALLAELPPAPHRVRLLVDSVGEAHLSAEPLQPLPEPYRVAIVAERQDLQGEPFVAHKTTHRSLYDRARRSVAGVDDVLLLNRNGELTESTIANLFVVLDGQLVTPPVAAGLLPGVYRQHLLDSGKAVERPLSPSDLRRAEVIYLGNSVRRLWKVALVDAQGPGTAEPSSEA